MRIITGKAKGIRLHTPKGLRVRPTLDRVKESIFNILSHEISFQGKYVLDLFSGTGNLGIEALSRGAEYAYFIDNNINSIKIITENINKTKMTEQSEVCKKDAIDFLEKFIPKKEKIDLIFCDPPYNLGWCEKLALVFSKIDILKKNGVLLIEHSIFEKYNFIDISSGALSFWRSEKYGEIQVIFLRGK